MRKNTKQTIPSFLNRCRSLVLASGDEVGVGKFLSETVDMCCSKSSHWLISYIGNRGEYLKGLPTDVNQAGVNKQRMCLGKATSVIHGA